MCRAWAIEKFAEKSRPDFTLFLEDPDEYGFTCLCISPDGSQVWFVDGEMTPMPVLDEYIAVGSGASYALGALDAGGSVEQALLSAAKRDLYTSAPFEIRILG